AVPADHRGDRVPWTAGGLAVASVRRLARGQTGRRPGDLLEFPRHGRRLGRRPVFHRYQELRRLPRDVPHPVRRHRHRQRLDLSDDPVDLPRREAPDLEDRRRRGASAGDQGCQYRKCGGPWIHRRHRCMRRILHPARLRGLDRHDWRAASRAGGVPRLLRHLHCADLVVLPAPELPGPARPEPGRGAGVSEFTEQQKRWLEGFTSGLAARKTSATPAAPVAAQPVGPDALQHAAQDRTVATGGKLVAEEKAKRQRHPLDRWDEVVERADKAEFPKGIDVFLTKYHGLFYVAPAENSFMCRLRIPNGILKAWQMRVLADAAQSFGGGYAAVTTRANLQIREIATHDAIDLLTAVQALGLTSRGSGADNIRNITGSPTAGIDPQELIDTRPLCNAMHHYILNHREMYGLPRKFNIAFDGGGRVPVLEDTNDIGFVAAQAQGSSGDGIYFRLQLGGITGHRDFAHETGVLLKPDECVKVAGAVVRAFIAHGDRTNRT